MANQLVNNYTPTQKQLGVAAIRRYGASMAVRMLEDVWENAPVRETLIRWRDELAIEPTEADEQFWIEREAQVRTELFARTSSLIPRVSSVIERLTDPSIHIDEVPASKLQAATISYGILHDKLVPPKASGNALIGNAEHVTLNVIAPSVAEPAERSHPPLVIDVEVSE